MKARIIEAVGTIGRLINERDEVLTHSDELQYELANMGFNDREINAALKWIENNTLGDLREESLRTFPEPEAPMRVLNPVEKARIGSRGHNFLLKLYKKGVLDNHILEDLLERLLKSDEEVLGMKEVRRAAALCVFARVQDEWKEFLNRTNTLVH